MHITSYNRGFFLLQPRFAIPFLWAFHVAVIVILATQNIVIHYCFTYALTVITAESSSFCTMRATIIIFLTTSSWRCGLTTDWTSFILTTRASLIRGTRVKVVRAFILLDAESNICKQKWEKSIKDGIHRIYMLSKIRYITLNICCLKYDT